MACNSYAEIENDNKSLKSSGISSEGCNSQKQLLSDSISATSKQNGEQAVCEDEQMSEQDTSERRKSGMMDLKTNSTSPSTLQRPAEELLRRNFQIPRKIKERKGLFQNLSPESREFDELVRLLSSFYLEPNSRGTFTYTKARLIHNELLEKEFIEKKRELKQHGRTDAELEETYGFLLPDKDKVQAICEKGLSVGHSRVSMLGSPAKGVYLSRYSDLLQVNTFEPGTTGEIIVFKIMKGKLKTIYESTPKNVVDPTQKFDCHVFKNASKVASLYSYRAFEHTQQYLFEFAYEELKARPRHVCPYAVLSFQYRGKETGASLNRLNSPMSDGNRVRRRYTVWSGTLVNKGEELFQISIRSSNLPLLPFRIPDKLDVSTAMHLDAMKRKIPALLSWDTFYGKREVLKYGMYCSLFEVVSKSKPGNQNLSGLLQKLEKDKIVLVKPLMDKGFLFLLSSAQMQISNERKSRLEKGLQALFIFQDPRLAPTKFSATCTAPPPRDPSDGVVLRRLEPFLPAIHHALLRLRSHPPKDLGAAVERQATDYLGQQRSGRGPPAAFRLPEYRQHLDERPGYPSGPRPRFSGDALRTYLHGPTCYQLATTKAHGLLSGEGLEQRRPHRPPPSVSSTVPAAATATASASASSLAISPAPSPAGMSDDRSPASDWGSQERAAPASAAPASAARVTQANGGSQRAPQRTGGEYDKEKMEKLLQLIHMHKRTLAGGREDEDDGWDAAGLKRRLEDEGGAQASKYLRTSLLSNGEPGRVPGSEEGGSEESPSLSLSMVMDSMGICDTDLRDRVGPTSETHRLIKLLMSTLNRAITHGASGAEVAAETLERVSAEGLGLELGLGRAEATDLDLRSRVKDEEPSSTQDYLEDQTAGSMSSMDVCSPASPGEPLQQATSSSDVLDHWGHSEKGPLPVPERIPRRADGDSKAMGQSLDAIVHNEFQCLSSHIKHLMDSQHIYYAPQAPAQWPDPHLLRLSSTFSTFVSHHVKPLAVQPYLGTLRERIGHLLAPPRSAPAPGVKVEHPVTVTASTPPAFTPTSAFTLAPAPGPLTVTAAPTTVLPPVHSPANAIGLAPAAPMVVTPSHPPPNVSGAISAPPAVPTLHHPAPIAPAHVAPSAVSITAAAASTPPPAVAPTSSFTPPAKAPTASVAPPAKTSSKPRMGTVKDPHKPLATAMEKAEKTPEVKPMVSALALDPPVSSPSAVSQLQQQQPHQAPPPSSDPALVPAPTANPSDSTSAANSLISQIKPDVFLSLVQMVQRNTLKFYIHVSEEDSETQLCTEIKDYLKSFGNVECNPQSFLENNNSLDKFLVIIQNEDIAMHVHKIPALVSLKQLPSVSFAGVDSLDDVKNRTYNELFVSGGLIVSDELILNSDLMTFDKLQRLLKFLEEQSSIWQWKVHCKTQKKLKELSRLNGDTMSMLNLLTTYQKKHLVDFLPYHECDAPTKTAPDVDCLVKLQAHHTQHRHIIFLTERKLEMLPHFSSHGILVASIEDILDNFTSIISFSPLKMEPPAPTAPPEAEKEDVRDECVEEEDMSLDSEDETMAISETAAPLPSNGLQQQQQQSSILPPPPQMQEFRPPLPEMPPIPDAMAQNSPMSYGSAKMDFAPAIAPFPPGPELGDNLAVSFGVNPHQSYLCPAPSQWSPFSGSTGYPLPSQPPSVLPPALPGQPFPQQSPMPNLSQSPAVGSDEMAPGEVPPGLPQPLPDAEAQMGVPATGAVTPHAAGSAQDAQSNVMEPMALPYPDHAVGPPMGMGYGWGGNMGVMQHSYGGGPPLGSVGSADSAELADTNAQPPQGMSQADGLWKAGGMCEMADGLTPGLLHRSLPPVPAPPPPPGMVIPPSASGPPPGPFLHAGVLGGPTVTEKSCGTPGSSTPSSQGSRTPVSSGPDSQPTPGPPAGRGSSVPRTLLSGAGSGGNGHGRGGATGHAPLQPPPRHANHSGPGGYNGRGAMTVPPPLPPPPMDMHGGFRARGAPPMPMRSRPGRGHMRGGPPPWGPPLRGAPPPPPPPDYYSDYTYP
ncbi:protein TASOR [Sardina pilchardus]|uniref:protein TASOR n=1 Tax=Sardina pilchardus TaxID=27697 RepID=UPI002E141ADC